MKEVSAELVGGLIKHDKSGLSNGIYLMPDKLLTH